MLKSIKNRLYQRKKNKFLKLAEELNKQDENLYKLIKGEVDLSTLEVIESDDSSLTFTIDNDLRVSIHTRINPDIAMVLLDHEYIEENQTQDNLAIEIAFLLMAYEAMDQILTQYEDKRGVLEEDNEQD